MKPGRMRHDATGIRMVRESSDMATFDYVIAGAGSAGCVLANRLSAQRDVTVCLLEAGPAANSLTIRMPAALTFPIESKIYNWRYASEPEPHLNNRRIGQARGRGLGGSSAINGMVWVRGNPKDYDGWKDFGIKGWSHADCLPYFKKLETYHGTPSPERGRDGLVSVVESKGDHVFYDRFLRAGETWGLPRARDYNSGPQDGTHLTQANIRDGVRCSAAEAYLRPVKDRSNLTVKTDVFVNKLRLDGLKVIGVECVINGATAMIEARREVIVSTGTIASPQLLMISGIGPADHLRFHGLTPLVDLQGVGENLHDHLRVGVRYQGKTELPGSTVTAGLFTWSATIADASRAPDLQFYVGRGLDQPDRFVTITVSHVAPRSRGTLRLRSKDPLSMPIIRANYLQHQDDVTALVRGVQLARKLGASSAYDAIRADELEPGPGLRTAAEIAAFVRAKADTIFHPAGTCRMGPDRDERAVVDSKLCVRGVSGLRVADASIMPEVVNATTHAACVMIGEKAADLVLGKAGA